MANPIETSAANETRAALASSQNRTRFGRVFVEHLLAECDAAKERAEKAEAAVAQLLEEKAAHFVDTTTMFRGLNVRDGQLHLEIEPAREMLLLWCASVRAMLDEHQAKNYTETDIEMPRQNSVSLDIQDGQNPTDSYTLTLQRRHGKTPHQLRQQAERERDEARAENEQLREENRELAAQLAEHPDEWGVALTEGDTSTTSAGKREDVARRSVAADPEHRRLMHRRGASKWQEVPDAT